MVEMKTVLKTMIVVGRNIDPALDVSNTSHPILFIANTADNVTPLRSALANAQGFPGSVVMIQDSYGVSRLIS